MISNEIKTAMCFRACSLYFSDFILVLDEISTYHSEIENGVFFLH